MLFEVELTFEMLTVRGKQHSFSTRHTNGCSCEFIKVFETGKVATCGWLEPPIFGLMSNHLTIWAIRARHLLSHVFEYWLEQSGYLHNILLIPQLHNYTIINVGKSKAEYLTIFLCILGMNRTHRAKHLHVVNYTSVFAVNIQNVLNCEV